MHHVFSSAIRKFCNPLINPPCTHAIQLNLISFDHRLPNEFTSSKLCQQLSNISQTYLGPISSSIKACTSILLSAFVPSVAPLHLRPSTPLILQWPYDIITSWSTLCMLHYLPYYSHSLSVCFQISTQLAHLLTRKLPFSLIIRSSCYPRNESLLVSKARLGQLNRYVGSRESPPDVHRGSHPKWSVLCTFEWGFLWYFRWATAVHQNRLGISGSRLHPMLGP